MSYIEESVWKEYLAGSEDIFKKIGESFLDSYKSFENQVLSSYEQNKQNELYNHIHSLKGITLNMGMTKLYEKCQFVLNELKQNITDLDHIKELLVVFNASYNELKPLI